VDDASRVVVHLDDLDAAELRTVDGLLYARADVDGLAEKFPEMQEGLDEFRAVLTGEDGVPGATVEAATALLDGDWVSVDVQAYLDSVQAFFDQMAGAAGVPPSGRLPDPSDVPSDELRDLLGKALEGAVTSVERRETDDELGDHLVAALDLRTAYATLRSGLPELFPGETADALEQLPPESKVPDKEIDVSFWVADADLTRVELDLAQFLDEPAGHLVLRADVRAPEAITVPSGAVAIDVAALTQAGLPAVPTDGAQPGDVPDPDARTVATWVDMDFVAVAAQTGVDPSVDLLPAVLPYYAAIDKMIDLTAVGERIQVTFRDETVCLTLSTDGDGENITDGSC